jgi:hypothetical protein
MTGLSMARAGTRDVRCQANASRTVISDLRQRLAALEASALRLNLAWIRLASEQPLHPLVEILGRDGLCPAGREFACRHGLRVVAQSTGSRGGMNAVWVYSERGASQG